MTDQQAPERIWFYADPIAGWLGSDKQFLTPEGVSTKHYVRADLLEAAEKRIADLEENMRIGNESWSRLCEARSNALTKAEAERDQALASVGAVIENLREYLVMKTGVSQEVLIIIGAAARAINPDATAALNEMLADAWDEGYTSGFHGRGRDTNPYRKEERNG